jgi:hypothetical protein
MEDRVDNNNIRSKHGRSRKRSAAAAEWVGHLNSTHHVGRALFSPFFLFHFVSCADPPFFRSPLRSANLTSAPDAVSFIFGEVIAPHKSPESRCVLAVVFFLSRFFLFRPEKNKKEIKPQLEEISAVRFLSNISLRARAAFYFSPRSGKQ